MVPEGALVQIQIGLGASQVQGLRAALRPVPAPLNARAIVDTGAEITSVDSSLIQALGSPVRGTILANLPAHGGLNVGFLYDAGLAIVHPSGKPRNDLVIPDMPVLELSLAFLGYQVLIGRDVLASCRFLYHGLSKRFRLAY